MHVVNQKEVTTGIVWDTLITEGAMIAMLNVDRSGGPNYNTPKQTMSHSPINLRWDLLGLDLLNTLLQLSEIKNTLDDYLFRNIFPSINLKNSINCNIHIYKV